MSDSPTKEDQFAAVAMLDRKRIEARVVAMEPRRYIEIEDFGLRITIDDARALRDWLNKVLP